MWICQPFTPCLAYKAPGNTPKNVGCAEMIFLAEDAMYFCILALWLQVFTTDLHKIDVKCLKYAGPLRGYGESA